MGKFDYQFDTDLVRQLERLANFDEVAPKLLDGAAPILEKYVRIEAAKHKRTADMFNSIKKTKAFKNEYGWFVTVRPTGKDRKGVRNMEKMVYAEYGTSKQPSTPMLTKALKDAETEVTEKMQELFNMEVGE